MIKGIVVGCIFGYVIGLAISLLLDYYTSVPTDIVLMVNIMAPLVLACGFTIYFVQRWW